MKRSEIKEHHESSVLDSFSKYMLENGNSLTVISKPEPPDALVTINQKETWVEITDAFINSDFAQSLTSFVADNMPHKSSDRKLFLNPDAVFLNKVESVVTNKYTKNSITNIFHKYGQGILLVGLYSPFVGSAEVEDVLNHVSVLVSKLDNRFSEIYLYDKNHNFYLVP